MNNKGILITGTDTGIGKTFVACGIARSWRHHGLRVGPFKPAETGCEWDASSQALVPADARLLQATSRTQASMETICPYRFRTPVAPAVAAEREGLALDVDRVKAHLKDCYATLASFHDVVIVESAGGILVPLAYGFHYGDLARVLDLPVLVVAGSKLGVLNHALLTISFLQSSGIRVVGCVLNHHSPEKSPATETNADALRKLIGIPLYVLPYFQDASRGSGEIGIETLSTELLARLAL